MCNAQLAIRFAARPLATQFCHPLGRGEDTTVGESQSAVDFFRRTDSVSSQAADAVVAVRQRPVDQIGEDGLANLIL